MSEWPLKLHLMLTSVGRWPLTLGMLGALTLGLWLALLPAAQRSSASQLRQLEAVRRLSAAPQAARPVPKIDSLASFEEKLATEEDLHRLMQQLWRQGSEVGLQMSKVDYRNERDTNGGFDRLAITLPMTGPYPAVRKFIFALMAEFPGLSLDKLDIKRDQASSGLIETTAHLTLFSRP